MFSYGQAHVSRSYDTNVIHGASGASLRIDYALPSGFCGLWNSLIGKDAFSTYYWNFNNLFSPLKNSRGNPIPVENVHVTHFSFWAKGNGEGNFDHQVKLELKDIRGIVADALFTIPNTNDWTRYEFPFTGITNDLSQMKEINFVIEDWRNDHRTNHLYIDDLNFGTDQPSLPTANWSDDALLDLISHRCFFYFLKFTDELGFALDRSTFSDAVSVGAIGFQLTAYCIGHRRGWADPKDLENRVVTILRNLNNISMGPEAGTLKGGFRGFYYHFLGAGNGKRKDANVEVSPYDTVLLMNGVLTCKEYFPNNPEIQTLSQQLFDRVEWDWLLDHSPGPNQNRFYLSWAPGPSPEGTFYGHVDGQTDEALMLDIQALGSRTHPVSLDTYLARNRPQGAYPATNLDDFLPSWSGSLFNYFFASCWLNFQTRGRDLHPTNPRDLWECNRRAIVANRQFCIDHASEYSTYGPDSWGLTACDNLTTPTPGVSGEYFAFGALPTEENVRFGSRALQVGTIAVYGAAGSINYTPRESMAALRHFFTVPGLWHPLMGFGDAFSMAPHFLDPECDTNGNRYIRPADFLRGPWVNNMTMGVDAGPMLLAIENYRTGQIWDLTARNPILSRGLDRIFGVSVPANFTIAAEKRHPDQNLRFKWSPVSGAARYEMFASKDFVHWQLKQADIRDTTWTTPDPGNEMLFYYLKPVAADRVEPAGLVAQKGAGSQSGAAQSE